MSQYTVKTTIHFDKATKKRVHKFAIDRGWTLSRAVFFCVRGFLDQLDAEEAKRIKGPPHPDQALSDLLAGMGKNIYDEPWNLVPRPPGY